MTKYRTYANLYSMKEFEVIEGKIKCLMSAPHAKNHRRPSLLKRYKIHERYTDDIVRDICSKEKCFGIYIKDSVDYDPSYHRQRNPYKEEVKTIVKENDIERFIDIHGLSEDHMIDIAIYYKTRFRKSIDLANEIAEALNKGKLKGLNMQILRLNENNQESLTEFVVSKLRVPSVQIEIARYIRGDKKLRKEFVNNLASVIS